MGFLHPCLLTCSSLLNPHGMECVPSGSFCLCPSEQTFLPFNPLLSSPLSSSRLAHISRPRTYSPLLDGSLRFSRILKAWPCFRRFDCCVVNDRGFYSIRSRLCRKPWLHGSGLMSGVLPDYRSSRNASRLAMRRAFSPQGGGNGTGRVVFNLAVAGFLTYLTVTGKLNWLFEAIFSLWLFLLVLAWFAERSLITGRCPNCGGEFQVFEFSLKEEPRRCPYCTQPFKLENKQFVREGPQFSDRQHRDSRQPFGGFGKPATPAKEQKTPTGVVVDVEAEVRDKD